MAQHNSCDWCAGNTAAATISATVAEIGAAMVAATTAAMTARRIVYSVFQNTAQTCDRAD